MDNTINIDEQLSVLEETKSLLKQAIIDKGQEVLDTDSFRSYVDKVSNIKTSEDLQEQLDAQDTVIQQLEDELANKTSGSVKPNIFMQEDEPTIKDGIWLKGNYQVDNIVADENVFVGEEWNTTKMSNLKAIPYNFVGGGAVSIGTNIYLFGSGDSSSYYKYAYKYDTLTNTYTKLTNIPFSFWVGGTVGIGTDIYLFGGNENKTAAYKYNTLTNSYTQLTNIPYAFYSGAAVGIGTDIYLFGGNTNQYVSYKYDTLTNTYTKLGSVAYSFSAGSAVAVGTDVYLFGSDSSSSYYKSAYKYDTLTSKYTKLTNIPYDFYWGAAVAVETNIYILGGSGGTNTSYKYNILTDTYTQIENIPYGFSWATAVSIGSEIYLLGGSNNPTKVQVLSMAQKTYENNSIIISQNKSNVNKTNIANYGIQNAKFYYDRVFYQDENGELLNTIPTYNGNGTEWVKISGGEG